MQAPDDRTIDREASQVQRFELDGNTYYQQTRSCNTPRCKCHSGQRHGPYWWCRDSSGHVKYLGLRLPEELAEARARRDQLLPSMASCEQELRAQAAKLLRQAEALERVRTNRAPQPGDEKIIADLGFSEALVRAGELASAQACTPQRRRASTRNAA
jgi:uncharacterized protein DUF6788